MLEVSSSHHHESNPLPYSPGATTIWNNSWLRIYDQFGNAIIAYARRRGLNDHSAQDVLQEVMVTIIRCQYQTDHGYDPAAGTFQSWLWGIIRNRVRSIRRKDEKEEVLSPIARTESEDDAAHSLPEISQPPNDLGRAEEDQWQQA
ncbi:MAG: sigma-70 family RNA polymerase sigma factor, partial [Verrucomicrobiota bacterium]